MFSVKRISHLIVICISMWNVSVFAQNNIQFSAPYFNQFSFNPARAGVYDKLDMVAVFRNQWAGISESPTVQNVSAHIPFDLLRGGIGFNIYNQTSGAERWTTLKLGYAYHLSIEEYSRLSFGGSLGIVNSSIDGAQLRTPDGTYINGVINHADADLPQNKVSSSTYIGDIGTHFTNGELEAGVSFQGIFGGELKFNEGFNSIVSDQKTLNVFLAYNLDFLQGITIIPHVYVKSNFDIIQTEVHLLARYNENLLVGGGLRGYDSNSLDAFIATVGVEMKNGLILLYAYDSSLSTLNTVSSGSHEFVIKYNIDTRLGKGKLPGIIYNPRNL